MPDIKICESTFDKLVFNRKTQSYKKAIEISRLILLQYHPDLSKGQNHVLALMFDMNKLWEQFVFVSLRKNKNPEDSITAQTSKYFWKPTSGNRSSIKPDIVINKDKPDCVVLDTKWKNLNGYNPSPEDLRQMFVYHQYFGTKRVALVYPGSKYEENGGKYLDRKTGDETDMECSVLILSIPERNGEKKNIVKKWQEEIKTSIDIWMKKEAVNRMVYQ